MSFFYCRLALADALLLMNLLLMSLLQRAQLQLQELRLQHCSTERLVSTTALGRLGTLSASGICMLPLQFSGFCGHMMQVVMSAAVFQTLPLLPVKASLKTWPL